MPVEIKLNKSLTSPKSDVDKSIEQLVKTYVKPIAEKVPYNIKLKVSIHMGDLGRRMVLQPIMSSPESSTYQLKINIDLAYSQAIKCIHPIKKDKDLMEKQDLVQSAFVNACICRDILIAIVVIVCNQLKLLEIPVVNYEKNKHEFINPKLEGAKELTQLYNTLTRINIMKVREMYPDEIVFKIEKYSHVYQPFKKLYHFHETKKTKEAINNTLKDLDLLFRTNIKKL